MCGIAGQISPKGLPHRSPDFYGDMLSTMTRRGPDQEGQLITAHCALLHRRLSVIDPGGGTQPMSIDGFTIVYNGELYNTEELRNDLIEQGTTFLTRSDTEVLLRAYLRWGDGCLSRLNGIFAFAIYELRNRRLFFARDPMGVKPLFYCLRDGSLFFASELKTLLRFPEIEPIVDARGLYDILFLGPGRTPGCGIFRNVHELKPGMYGYFSDGGLQISPYWELKDGEFRDSFSETAEKTRFLVEDSIRRQLVSDVPVGTFLSGGLDSSIVSAVAAGEISPLSTYSVDYKDNDQYFHATKFQPNSDNHYIDLMVNTLSCDAHRIMLDTDALVSGLFAAAEARDLPGMADVDSSMLLLCQEARKDSTVVLSGECADEIFGGYPWYRDPEIRTAYGFPWSQTTDYRASFVCDELLSWLPPREFVDNRYQETLATVDKCPDLSPLESRMKEMMVLNLRWFMQTLLDSNVIKYKPLLRAQISIIIQTYHKSGAIRPRFPFTSHTDYTAPAPPAPW